MRKGRLELIEGQGQGFTFFPPDSEREGRFVRSRGTSSLPRMGATYTASLLDLMNGTKHVYSDLESIIVKLHMTAVNMALSYLKTPFQTNFL